MGTVTDTDSGVTTYSYDDVGNRATATYPNGTVASFMYDSQNRLDLLTNKRSDNSTISTYDYTVAAAGNRTAVLEHNARNAAYEYDDVYRLTRETIVDLVAGNRTISYTYDNVGNRLTKVDSGSGTAVYSYDNNDRLLTEGTTAYTYDNNGNTRTKSDGSVTTNYAYDFENRLIRADSPGNNTDYQYDADGNRVQSTTNGVVTKYLVDTNRDYAQVLEERDGANALIVSYTYGDDLIRQKRGNVISYYQYDGQLSTRQLTDSAAAITDTYTFDAFGNLLAFTGNTPNNYLYTGEQFDPNVAFYYLRARYYNQANGRFFSSDLWEGNELDPLTLHKYVYCSGNAANCVDPTGREGFVDALVSLAIRGTILTTSIGARVGPIFGIITLTSCDLFLAYVNYQTLAEFDYFPQSEFVAEIGCHLDLVCQLSLFVYSQIPAYAQKPKGINNPRVREAVRIGNRVHYDKTTDPSKYTHVGGPTQLQERYPNTLFEFAKRGQGGFDVSYRGGQHPSSYAGSKWPVSNNQADFKPNTPTGIAFKLPGNVYRILYNPKTGTLQNQ